MYKKLIRRLALATAVAISPAAPTAVANETEPEYRQLSGHTDLTNKDGTPIEGQVDVCTADKVRFQATFRFSASTNDITEAIENNAEEHFNGITRTINRTSLALDRILPQVNLISLTREKYIDIMKDVFNKVNHGREDKDGKNSLKIDFRFTSMTTEQGCIGNKLKLSI